MSSNERPTLGGTRIKTRKRNIAAPLDPSTFADAVVQIYLEHAGDLELIAKDIESSDLDFSRYGDTFFEEVMDEEVFNSSSQEVGSFGDFEGSDAMVSGSSQVESSKCPSVVRFVTDELSEVFGNQGFGTCSQNNDIMTGVSTSLVDNFPSNLALISEFQREAVNTYFLQSLFDAERVEHGNISVEPTPLHFVTDLGKETSYSFHELIGRHSSLPLERLCTLPTVTSLPESFPSIDGGPSAHNTALNFYPMETIDCPVIGLQQRQNGFSSSSLFGCTTYQGDMRTNELLNAIPSSEPQIKETRADSFLNAQDQFKRLQLIPPSNFGTERACKDLSTSPQCIPTNREVSRSRSHSHGINVNTQGSATPNQSSEQRIRACRGQATDPHSISERIRRVKISERLRTLQSLVPDSNKTDKASILDEIIDYVKLLKLQIFTMSKIRCHGVGANAQFITDFNAEASQNIPGAGGCSQDIELAEKMAIRLLKEDFNAGAEYLKNHGIHVIHAPEPKQVSDTGVGSRHISSNTKGMPKDKLAQRL